MDALESAIKWYREGYRIQRSEFAGVNLATLLVARGERIEANSELEGICNTVINSIGRKGTVENLRDYWEVATLFEIAILAENHQRAIAAAGCMYKLRPPAWYIGSTVKNLRLIVDSRYRVF
jgi:mitogen-activated protein kinase kinase kinase 5